MPKKAGVGFLESAEKVLGEADEPMTCKQIVKVATSSGFLQSNGKTPENTLHAMLTRDIRDGGKSSRFVKNGPGKFSLAKS